RRHPGGGGGQRRRRHRTRAAGARARRRRRAGLVGGATQRGRTASGDGGAARRGQPARDAGLRGRPMNRLRRGVRWLSGLVDPYIVVLFAVVALAAVFPARGAAVVPIDWATAIAIGMLFFLYGARLSTRETLDGFRHWRLHLLVLAFTFGVFPLLGWGLSLATGPFLPAALASGLLFLSLVPSTVQSSVTFTSLAGGNVAASVVAASFSNLVGIIATPLLAVALLHGSSVELSASSVQRLVLQLLAPFLLGRLVHGWLGPWLRKHKKRLAYLDRIAILLVVYTAFSAGMRAE